MEENQNVSTNTNNYNNYGPMKEQDDVVSMWAFMGLQLLYCIPCVGLIAAIIIAFAAGNKNIKNHARGLLLITVFAVAISLIISLAFGVGLASLFGAAASSTSSSLYY